MKSIRTIVALSLVLFLSACATAVMMDHYPQRENDDRTELQKRLDREISKKVNKKFQQSSIVRDTALKISTYKHVVTLNGFVGNRKQKLTALKLTLSVRGVKSVISDIGIRKY